MTAHKMSLLRGALMIDAAISGATGLLLASGAGVLEELLALPQGLLRYAGLSLLPFAAVVGYVSTREALSPASVRTVVALNAVWVVASVALLLSGQVSPNALGITFVLGQAMAVAALADVQYFGLRRTATQARGLEPLPR
jgi:hypothetical protein